MQPESIEELPQAADQTREIVNDLVNVGAQTDEQNNLQYITERESR